jgi:3-deoxy-D-manno-octulosonic-acid transferase
LVLAPRHPPRFDQVCSVAAKFAARRATEMLARKHKPDDGDGLQSSPVAALVEIVVLDTIGDLAAVYGVADVAFVGGSLVDRGGHNPLEAARFGVPVVMGASYGNFREMVDAMRAAHAVRIVSAEDLAIALNDLLTDPAAAQALGDRGRRFFEAHAGATERVVPALLGLLR